MSTLTSLARAYAVDRGLAQPITTVCHAHISTWPLVCVPLAMAGEANAPLAVMIGDDRDAPRVLIVPQPRNRELRFGFVHSLALVMLHYVGSFAGTTQNVARRSGPPKARPIDAPQLWVPNHGGIDFLRLLGRSTRFRSTTGPHAVEMSVPTVGKWLTFLGERAEYPGSSLFLAATDVLTQHWATGQSAIEDQNLAALLGWIAPPEGMTGAAAARLAEDPLLTPPAGPATDPTFDREVLAPAIAEYDRATGAARQRRATARLEAALRDQLAPTWALLWQAIDLLRALPPGGHVAARWDRDKDAYLRFHTYLAGDGRPQPKRDSAVASALRLNELERYKAAYDAQRAFDDPLVMAEHRITGEAFAGTVTSVVPDRQVGVGQRAKLRPLITVSTSDPVRLVPGDATVTDQRRPRQVGQILTVTGELGDLEITLELAGGTGRRLTAPAGTVPLAGDQVCFSSLTDSYQQRGNFPAREDTPWTHGGPPAPPAPRNDDGNEEWS
ncbi:MULTISPECIES: hypothetical protein [Amycolatopsis]|uniref:Uncharacterized protein n=1 Tax=Amycolatopsis bullii TaxID=941987 RepID=A0ABQ3KRI8_9PSEU|nr:hypothetical protein [Amycolatopsis bullii]GHG41297.1 hypothetical protein GCM10017567_73550 [Amycolatopsis bullii]